MLTFVVSFLVVGQFWIAHHGTFGPIRRYDHTVVWLNLIALLTVAFLPFPSAPLGLSLAVAFWLGVLPAARVAVIRRGLRAAEAAWQARAG